MEHTNKQRLEFIRLDEIESYFSAHKSSDITIIALAFFIGLYIHKTASSLIIGLSLIKLLILTTYSVIETYFKDPYPLGTRYVQFWIYRFILLLQMALIVWLLVEISYKS